MCGIFGVSLGDGYVGGTEYVRRLVDELFILSESRGKEASGIALRERDEIIVFKSPLPGSALIRSGEYDRLFNRIDASGGPLQVLGHSRLVTNGVQLVNDNNQPVLRGGSVGVHNGIIVNTEELWRQSALKKLYDVDTEVFLALFEEKRKSGTPIQNALSEVFNEITGATTMAIMFNDIDELVIGTNNGSLYMLGGGPVEITVFASEKYILKQLVKKSYLRDSFTGSDIKRLDPGVAASINYHSASSRVFSLEKPDKKFRVSARRNNLEITDCSTKNNQPENNGFKPLAEAVKDSMIKTWENVFSGKTGLKRCSCCILPETMPLIEFDEDGVCNYCRGYEEVSFKGKKALETDLEQYRKDAGLDCIVGVSGGRDSSYGLHYIKEELGMNPLAFTYDWGMVTDLARRNVSRLCGELGVEHILVSADIAQKRENVRKNINAWLARPDLGMVPLFMAGDKQFFYYAHKLREQNNIGPFIFCAGVRMEETLFKYGFCGFDKGLTNATLTTLSLGQKAALFKYYIKQYLANPRYLNKSMMDTLFAYYSTYMLKDDYLYLYHYIPWDEEKILSTLINEYDWELAKDTEATWRIGDGTAPFYNYIYLAAAGFTEFDSFRSNQVREGMISREEALRRVRRENRPWLESIGWYARTIGFDINRAVKIINSIPKLY